MKEKNAQFGSEERGRQTEDTFTPARGGEVSENTTRRRRASAGSETSAPRPARPWAAARPAKQSRCAAPAVKALIWVDSARMTGPRLGRLREGALRWKPRWCSRASVAAGGPVSTGGA